MTIFRTAYDTTVGSGAVLNKITDAIKESEVRDSYSNLQDVISNPEMPVVIIAGHYTSQDNIPFFHHPLELSLRDPITKESKSYLYTDVRILVAKRLGSGVGSGLRIRNETEFMFNIARTTMSSAWLTSRPEIFRDISFVPVSVYSSWISEAVARRYALDAKDQMTLAVICALFYQSLFVSHYHEIKDNEDKIAHAIIRATRAPSQMVFDVLGKVTAMNDIKDLCTNIKDILENTRLDDFNEGILVTAIGSTWFGTNAKEMMAIALEHPPTWLTLVFYSFTERSYKNSIIAKIASRYLAAKGGDSYVKAFSSMFRTYCDPDEVVKL